MPIRAVVRRSYYRDSMVLMRVAETLRALGGIREAAALMGTPANHELLAAAGLATAETKGAASGDLVIALLAETESAAEAGLARPSASSPSSDRPWRRRAGASAHARLGAPPDARREPGGDLGPRRVRRRSSPARATARLHVFLFSDNVSLDDEIALKRLGRRARLACMGPDCGTAYVNGVGLGFANVVDRGRVGCVAASGTGLQAVVSRLAALGEGVSHGLGVGGRDLSAEVGGVMTMIALDALAARLGDRGHRGDRKPPAAEVVPRLESAIARVAKPVVVCLSRRATEGRRRRNVGGDARRRCGAGGRDACAVKRGARCVHRSRRRASPARARAIELGAGRILGLYTGGTLAHEAGLVLEPLVGA